MDISIFHSVPIADAANQGKAHVCTPTGITVLS